MVYLHEIAHAIRALRRTTAFTAVTLTILAMGIAASALIFSVINAAVLRPLPYPGPEKLVVLNWYSSGGLSSPDISASAFFLLQERARSFASLAASLVIESGVNLSGIGKPQYVRGLRVSGGFFQTLGTVPVMGRSFSSEEEQPGGPHAVVLSHGLWVQNFGEDPDAVGREVRIDGELYTVVGVMPGSFRSYPEADLWLPLQLTPATAEIGNEYRVIGRLRDGVTLEDAQRELDDSREYSLTFPVKSLMDQMRLKVNGLQSLIVSGVRPGLILLFGAVLFVLLIMCTNLAVLLTVRAAGRIREIAIRLALGASRASVVRSFFMESLVLALVGGILGIILAKEAIPFVLLLAPANDPLPPVGIDGRVVLFTALVSLITSVAFGMSPALRMSRANLNGLLRQATSNATSGSQHARLSSILVSAQAALTILLLTGAGLLLRSFTDLHATPPGFDSQHLWAIQISLASERYKTASSTAQFLEQLCRKIRAKPGVEAASSVTGLPLEPGLNLLLHSGGLLEKTAYAQYRIVGVDYFQAMRIRLIRGRSFSESDSAQTEPVAIVNQTLARQWWPDESSLGHYLDVDSSMGNSFLHRQIVGVVTDVHESGLSLPPSPTIFVPSAQTPDSIIAYVNRMFPTSIVIRTASSAPPTEYVRAAVSSADPDLPLASVRAFSDIIAASLTRERFYTYLIAGFGVFALLLTAIGLYALLSYQIVLRTREIGLRIAVGATRFEVVAMIVRRGVGLVLLGAAIGMAVVPLETTFLASMLYNVRSIMPVALIGAVIMLAVVAALAGLLSTVRAASIEPAVTLNSE